MSKLITRIKQLALALCLATPIVSWAATPVAVWDGDFNDLTKFTGYELVDWNQTHGENNSTVTIDRANQGLMFRSSTGKAGVTVLVRYSNLSASNNNRVLFTTTINSDYTGTRTGIRMDSNGALRGIWGNTEWNDNRNSNYGSVPASGVMAFTYSKAGTYLYSGSNADRLAETWKCTSLMSSADTDSSQIRGVSIGGYNEGASANGYEAALGMTIDAVAVFDSVITLAEMQEYTWPSEESSVCAVSRTVAADATVNWTDAAWTVGETADQTFTPSADALYNVTVKVGGDCTIVMPETIGTFNRRKIKFVLDDGVGSATVALKYPGTLPESGSSVTLNSFGDALVIAGSGVTLSPGYNGDTAGYIVSVSDLTVTIVKGSNYEGTLTADTNWSDIKPEGWENAIAGEEPSIVVNYEGEEPITLTFDEAVTAGSLTITGNIVVEAAVAATFGTVTAGAGSVVEMANMTITTQAGAGTYRYRSNYPGTVPNQSLTYEYVGGADSESAGAVTLSGMRGTVKTTGFMNISGYYPLNTASHLDVVSGTTTLTAGGQGICGYITIREGATLVNTATDSLAYSSYNSELNIYGTLDMGTSRWTVWSGATFNFRGGEMIGTGEGDNGALDFMGTCNVYAYADSTISGNVKFRNALSNVTVAEGVTLTISGETKQGYNGGGITKKGAGTLKFTSDPYVPGGIVVEAGTLAFDTESDVDPVVTYTAAVLKDANMDYVSASNWKGRVVVSAVAAGTTSTQIALNKTGNENSYLTLNGVSGNAWCANDDYTVQPAITLAGGVNFENGSSGKTVTFRKIAAGSGNLSLKRWSSCTGITYGFTTLDADNYTGTIQLDGSVLTFNVGDILKANAQPGDKVLPLTVANNATVNLSGAKVNGEAADLEVKEDGIYIAVPVVNVTITVPNVLNATVVVSDGSTIYAPTTEGGESYVVPEGADITATYTADDGYSFDGAISSFELSNVAQGDAVTVGELVAKAYVVQVGGGANVRKYTSLSAAMSSLTGQDMGMVVKLLANVTETSVTISTACQIVQLNGDGKTLTADVVVPAGAILAMNNIAVVGDVSVAGGLYMVGATGIDVTGGLTLDDGATIYYTTLSEETPLLTVSGEVVVEGDMTVYQSSSTPLANGTYKLVTGESVDRDETATVTVSLNGNPAPGWSLGNTETTLLLAVAAASVDGVNYATFEEAVDAANGVETIELLSSAAYQLAVDETVIIKAGEFTFTATAPEGYVITSTSGVEEGVVVYTTAVAVAKMTRRYNDDGSWIVNIEADYATVAEAIAATEDSDNNTRYTVTLLAATAADITVDKVIAVEAGNNNVTGTITVTADGATVTLLNEPELGENTWILGRNTETGVITVGYGLTCRLMIVCSNSGEVTPTGVGVREVLTANTWEVRGGTEVTLTTTPGTDYSGYEYRVDSGYYTVMGDLEQHNLVFENNVATITVTGDTQASVTFVVREQEFTIPEIEHLTVTSVYKWGDPTTVYTPVAGKYSITQGTSIVIRYTPEEGYMVTYPGGYVEQDIQVTAQTTTIDNASIATSVKRIVAMVGDVPYDSLTSAISMAVGNPVTLVADTTENVSVYNALTLSANGRTITGTLTIQSTGSLNLGDEDAVLTVTGLEFGGPLSNGIICLDGTTLTIGEGADLEDADIWVTVANADAVAATLPEGFVLVPVENREDVVRIITTPRITIGNLPQGLAVASVTENGNAVEANEDGSYTVAVGSKVIVNWTNDGEYYVTPKKTTINSVGGDITFGIGDYPYPTVTPAVIEYTNTNDKKTYYNQLPNSLEPGTYKLLADDSRTQRAAYSLWAYSVTIDLNGHTFTSSAPDCMFTLGRAGTAENPRVFNVVDTSVGKGGRLVYTTAKTDTTALISVGKNGKYNEVTIGEGVTVTGGCIAMLGENQTLTVNGIVNGGADYGIVSHGLDTKNLTLTVGANAEIVSGITAIYLPGTGTATIAGTVTGATGIEIRSGTLNVVDGAVITANGAFSEVANGSGTTVYGAAIAISQHTTNNAIAANITGGSFSSIGANGVALYVTDTVNADPTGVTVSITGGTFTAPVVVDDSASDVTKFISGGTYSTDVKAYCADGKTTEQQGNVYVIVDAPSGIDPTDTTPTVVEPEIEPGDTDEDIQEKADAAAQEVPVSVSTYAEAAITAAATAPEATKTKEELAAEYQACFTKTAVKDEVSGDWVVKTDISQTTQDAVNTDASESLMEAIDDPETEEVSVKVPAGLYYVIETYDTLGGQLIDSQEGWSAGETLPVAKPESAESGFIKVILKAAP